MFPTSLMASFDGQFQVGSNPGCPTLLESPFLDGSPKTTCQTRSCLGSDGGQRDQRVFATVL